MAVISNVKLGSFTVAIIKIMRSKIERPNAWKIVIINLIVLVITLAPNFPIKDNYSSILYTDRIKLRALTRNELLFMKARVFWLCSTGKFEEYPVEFLAPMIISAALLPDDSRNSQKRE